MFQSLQQLFRYGVVGVLNTTVTLLVIFAATALGVEPLSCNAAGFVAGIVNSYFWNSRFTFAKRPSVGSAVRFTLAAGLGYAINVLFLHGALSSGAPPAVSQLIAIGAYNIAFFLFLKTAVFGCIGRRNSN